MKPLEIKKGIYWVGAVDWNVRSFHGHTYSTKRGTTYNSYLIVDEKIALVDAVYGPFARELIEKISQIVPPEKIDYVPRPVPRLSGPSERPDGRVKIILMPSELRVMKGIRQAI